MHVCLVCGERMAEPQGKGVFFFERRVGAARACMCLGNLLVWRDEEGLWRRDEEGMGLLLVFSLSTRVNDGMWVLYVIGWYR
jgi:hypothetical protein